MMPKRVIDLSKDALKTRITALSYGASRSGKTRFLAGFPRPLVIADAKESGWETMRTMPDDAFYEPGRKPVVWAVDDAQQMMESIRDAEADIKRDPDSFWTVGVDSLTFYVDGYLAELELRQRQAKGGDAGERRLLYQDLAFHLKYLMGRVHQLHTTNIVWLCLHKEPEEGKLGGPLLVGQMAGKAPALCDHLFYHRTYRPGGTGEKAAPPVYEIRTRPWGPFIAGGRDGGALPDPLVLDEECGFKQVEQFLGLEPRAARPAPVQGVARRVGAARPINR